MHTLFQLAHQMDEGHQKQVEELNQELIEVKVSDFHTLLLIITVIRVELIFPSG